jgi:hypothetical protein
MTPQLLSELIAVHSSCVHDQEGRCPLLLSVASLCWEINQAMGVANDEDCAFKRHDPMCAARPLGRDDSRRNDVEMFDEQIATLIKADGTVEQKRWVSRPASSRGALDAFTQTRRGTL